MLEDEDDADPRGELELEDENEREIESTLKSVPLIDMCEDVRVWCKEIELALDLRGVAHRFDPHKSLLAGIQAAMPDTDPGSHTRRYMRYINQARAVSEGKAPRTLYGRISEEYASQSSNVQYTGNIADHMNDPYEQIYHDSEDEADGDNDEEEYDMDGQYYLYINADLDESDDADEDYSD